MQHLSKKNHVYFSEPKFGITTIKVLIYFNNLVTILQSVFFSGILSWLQHTYPHVTAYTYHYIRNVIFIKFYFVFCLGADEEVIEFTVLWKVPHTTINCNTFDSQSHCISIYEPGWKLAEFRCPVHTAPEFDHCFRDVRARIVIG